jgi:hypothetical protein
VIGVRIGMGCVKAYLTCLDFHKRVSISPGENETLFWKVSKIPLGLRAVAVPHSPDDGSIVTVPSPSPFPLMPANWMDGAWDAQGGRRGVRGIKKERNCGSRGVETACGADDVIDASSS